METGCKQAVVQSGFGCIEQDTRQEQQPDPSMLSTCEELGTDEENIIWYMARYIPFKLMKVYEKNDKKSEMAVASPGDRYIYT